MSTPRIGRRAPTKFDRNFHHDRPEYAENTILRHIAEGTMTPEDGTLIRNFVAELKATKGISVARANKLVSHLCGWRHYLGPFTKNHIPDINAGVAALREARPVNGRPFKSNTQRDYITILRQFYLWLIENEYSTVQPGRIRKIQKPPQDRMTKTSAELLNPEEVRGMIEASISSRDRAMVSVIYEGALRLEEIGLLTWDQVEFTTFGIALNVDCKTGKPRRIPLVSSREYLVAWRNDYPCVITPGALVFISQQHNPLTYDAVLAQFKKLGRRAGIEKRIHGHLLRHSRITEWKRQGVSESVIGLMGWGDVNAPMLRYYCHLTNTDTETEVLKMYGIQRESAPGATAMYPRECARCAALNSPTAAYCVKCTFPLTETAARSMEELISILEGTPEYRDALTAAVQKLAETGS